MKDSLTGADLVFVDPDNGVEPTGYSYGSARAGNSIVLTELHELATPGRCLIVYHRQSHRKGGHLCEIVYWAERLRAASLRTLCGRSGSRPRVFSAERADFDDEPSRLEWIGRDGSHGTLMRCCEKVRFSASRPEPTWTP